MGLIEKKIGSQEVKEAILSAQAFRRLLGEGVDRARRTVQLGNLFASPPFPKQSAGFIPNHAKRSQTVTHMFLALETAIDQGALTPQERGRAMALARVVAYWGLPEIQSIFADAAEKRVGNVQVHSWMAKQLGEQQLALKQLFHGPPRINRAQAEAELTKLFGRAIGELEASGKLAAEEAASAIRYVVEGVVPYAEGVTERDVTAEWQKHRGQGDQFA
jgi:hypothetical protein